MQVSVQVCVFIFDLLMADGEPLIKQSLRERRARIAQALPNLEPGHIQLAQSQPYEAPDADSKPAAEQACSSCLASECYFAAPFRS